MRRSTIPTMACWKRRSATAADAPDGQPQRVLSAVGRRPLQWAKQKDLRQFRASLLLSAAENCAVLGDVAAGRRHARRGPGDDRPPRHGGRRDRRPAATISAALLAFQQKRIGRRQHGPGRGDGLHAARLALAVPHRAWPTNLYAGGVATPRTAMDLFADVLRDPQPADWALRPDGVAGRADDAASAAVGALVRGGHGAEAKTSDGHRDRRPRPAASLLQFVGLRRPAGVVALDLEAPTDQSAAAGPAQRQDLLARYPAYDRLCAAGAGDSRRRWPRSRWRPRTPAALKEQARHSPNSAGRPAAGGDLARNRPAPRAGGHGLSAAAQRRGGPEIAARRASRAWSSSPRAGSCTDSC